jgi:hypothetical protein
MGAEYQMEWTLNPNRLKHSNGGRRTQMHCSNKCDHVLANGLTGQSASVGSKCTLKYRSSLHTKAADTTAKCQEKMAKALNNSKLQQFKSSCKGRDSVI